ncbi:MAG: hypothetical protein Q7T18_08840 [Sedimentisphaerales bacterium]|nr:hypothetical protein [Sedimentisphaerales bacterium]
MEKKDKSIVLEWRVVSLGGGSSLEKGIIPIEAMKFKTVRKALRIKGYRRLPGEGQEIKFSQPSVRGLVVAVNETERSIRAISPGQSSLAQVINDFDLPMYRAS